MRQVAEDDVQNNRTPIVANAAQLHESLLVAFLNVHGTRLSLRPHDGGTHDVRFDAWCVEQSTHEQWVQTAVRALHRDAPGTCHATSKVLHVADALRTWPCVLTPDVTTEEAEAVGNLRLSLAHARLNRCGAACASLLVPTFVAAGSTVLSTYVAPLKGPLIFSFGSASTAK